MKLTLVSLPLTAAVWGEWQAEKFCGYSLTMIAEDEGDEYTQETCLAYC
jgi:hypothetical protein